MKQKLFSKSLATDSIIPMVAATVAFVLAVPGGITGLQREISKMASMISKTSNITEKKY